MKIALDWTPNVMHTGLYVAKVKGWLDIDFISPAEDDYSVLPATKVVSGLADFSIGPPESLISHHLETDHPQLLAVAPILYTNASAFVARKENNIQTIIDWSGKTYAALDIPFERQTLDFIMKKGNTGGFLQVGTNLKLDTWKMLVSGETDLTWVFLPVEGTEAQYNGIELSVFRLEDYGIPYPHCPFIQTSRNLAEADPDAINHFIKAAQKGYQFAVDYPEEAVGILRKESENNWIVDMRLLLHCQQAVNKYYLNENHEWGKVNKQGLSAYINWLYNEQIIDRKPDLEKMLWKAIVPASPAV